jgi:multidrug efflux pump subunit AcrA (membrane-fusion protein)
MKKLFVFYCLLVSGLSNAQQASEQGQYWLTGIIVSAQSQVVSAPKGSNWRVQVQWMASEGEIVQAGDLIAVFDSGSIQTDLDQARALSNGTP